MLLEQVFETGSFVFRTTAFCFALASSSSRSLSGIGICRRLSPDEDLSARSFTVDASLSSLLVSALTSEGWPLERAAADELDDEAGAEMAL